MGHGSQKQRDTIKTWAMISKKFEELMRYPRYPSLVPTIVLHGFHCTVESRSPEHLPQGTWQLIAC